MSRVPCRDGVGIRLGLKLYRNVVVLDGSLASSMTHGARVVKMNIGSEDGCRIAVSESRQAAWSAVTSRGSSCHLTGLGVKLITIYRTLPATGTYMRHADCS